jgi:HTH-type transcriptional regulator/antitoxin HigA
VSAGRGTPESDELEALVLLTVKYEDAHFPLPPSNPVAAIRFIMAQRGLTPHE